MNQHKHNQIILKNIYLKPSQLLFISQIHNHFSNTKVNFCKQKYLLYPLLTTQFNHSKQPSKFKIFHKNSCIEPQSTTPKSLQKFSFILPIKTKFPFSFTLTIRQSIFYSLLESNLRLLNYTIAYLTISLLTPLLSLQIEPFNRMLSIPFRLTQSVCFYIM